MTETEAGDKRAASAENNIIVFGDCHLAVGVPSRTKLLMAFLNSLPDQAGQIIILGDLFDFWLGAKHLFLPDFSEFLDRIDKLTRNGREISLIPGNRDFLLGKKFTERTGVQLLGDFETIRSGHVQFTFTHGDLLCTGDWRYRLWRKFIRNPLIRFLIGCAPLWMTRRAAILMRKFSQSELNRKKRETIGFDETAAANVLGENGDILVSGHSHVPETRTLHHRAGEKLFCSLGDWKETGVYMTITNGDFCYRRFSLLGDEPISVPHRTVWNQVPESRKITPVLSGRNS